MQRGGLTTQSRGGSGSGELLAEVSRAMVQLYKDCYEKGPTKARSYVVGDLVVCLLEGGFRRGERTLVEAGRGDAVAVQREAVQEVLRHRFVETIESLTGRRVITFISGVDVESEMNAELFILEPAELDTGDERDAVNAWAQQMRRQARDLRGRSEARRSGPASLRPSRSPTGPERSEP